MQTLLFKFAEITSFGRIKKGICRIFCQKMQKNQKEEIYKRSGLRYNNVPRTQKF